VKAGTDSATDQDWRTKYFDSLRVAEGEERQFRALEAVLKRVAGRLCIASQGQSPQLDEELKKLQAAIRGEATSSELEKITAALTDAISLLDEPAATHATQPQVAQATATQSSSAIIGEERIRAIFSALLAELRRDPELTVQADTLDAKLAKVMSGEQLPDVLSSLTEMVTKRIRHIELAKQEVEALLSQMVGKLDEIGRSVVDQSEHHDQSRASSETLNTHLITEIKAMGETVESADDFQQLRTQVRYRLDSIDRCLQEYRQRETTLASSFRARNEQMAARVAELEAEAGRLHTQLKDEQRTATMDTLTKVSNRLAYEKRMEEELQRWHRFKQPTCIAAWDIDYFKRINDTHGHRAGDGVLRAVADCLSGRVRSTDFFARYGGEEFVMILSGTKLEDGMRLVDLMRTAIAKLKLHFKGTPIPVTISCGITALQEGDLMGTAFERADKGLYVAKERGRNCCVST
jgi:diguanylate cyclase